MCQPVQSFVCQTEECRCVSQFRVLSVRLRSVGVSASSECFVCQTEDLGVSASSECFVCQTEECRCVSQFRMYLKSKQCWSSVTGSRFAVGAVV